MAEDSAAVGADVVVREGEDASGRKRREQRRRAT